MNPQDWKLILLALIAITSLIVLITKAKVNAFLSLLMASLIVGLGAVLLLDVPTRDATGKVLAAIDKKCCSGDGMRACEIDNSLGNVVGRGGLSKGRLTMGSVEAHFCLITRYKSQTGCQAYHTTLRCKCLSKQTGGFL
jgi:hypothetical protein